jgi:DNA-directed RNA polymerase specialized sigma subunit
MCEQDINDRIADNMNIVYYMINRMYLNNDPQALSLGLEALYNALQTYTANEKTKFSTYACVCIYNTLGGYIRTMNKLRQVHTVSYDALISYDTQTTLLDTLPDDCDIEADYIHKEECGRLYAQFVHVYNCTHNPVHKNILSIWHLNDFNISATDIAKIANVSQSYVSNVLAIYKTRIKKSLKE